MSTSLNINYWKLLKRRWPTLLIITLVFLLVSLVFTLLQPFQYESTVKILVIQKSAVNLDAYSASKSAERIGRNLSQIIYSSSFFNKVFNSGYPIDTTYFKQDEEDRRDQWAKMVDAQVPGGTTILQISVYHQDRSQAQVVAQAISYVLSGQAEEYVGISDVELKVVDTPLTSQLPVKPNFLLNLAFGIIIGFFLSMAYLILTYTEEHEIKEVFLAKPKPNKKQIPVQKLTWSQKRFLKKQRKLDSLKTKNHKPRIELPDVEKSLKKDKLSKTDYFVAKQPEPARPQVNFPPAENQNTDLAQKNPEFDLKKLPDFKDEDHIQSL
ncbi:hypothetical protein A2533_03440 [Candidatus Falkowbacteria bacterium RIFOXYD2_FULL_35_9]|uniref:Polysaccharide chain length determinant N-terminal domain-containing protein n=1 Tax=Candidatus Falkowbacteria bacterium RIFOXYC2_FULL_36_12 TaxID=1798002 RepID=A0A1F5SYH7_9BACT|nr:MAG: hypothetical protein A2300_01675 [Candidatus Falkowbacteria bacterium RIFOXYB2_FULL_35_7]OGF31778.1 MAG: hypothetical protein A2478_04815 [Candidatus Falkowbacteria bacterium RIFOXYC2_FULL_36_12]OGF48019.1 MAG: hypothetical protein A2533_03440 [Candidatus Falkowbacteria bacterium RIFOXYD2_FULL_35_9]